MAGDGRADRGHSAGRRITRFGRSRDTPITNAGVAEQGRGFIELYGAVLVGALAACDAALERESAPETEVELPEVDSVIDVWDEARDERNGVVSSLGALGEAIWIYGTSRDPDAALLPTMATKLLQVVWLDEEEAELHVGAFCATPLKELAQAFVSDDRRHGAGWLRERLINNDRRCAAYADAGFDSDRHDGGPRLRLAGSHATRAGQHEA